MSEPTPTFASRWLQAARHKGAPVCVGLDPVLEQLPGAVRDDAAPVVSVEGFCRGVIDAVACIVPAVKPQLACFERYGSAGVAAYERVVDAAHDAGLLVIADAKRGDIGVSARHYAAAFLEGDHAADAVTVNPYLGPDTLGPFIEAAARRGKLVFVLVRTSNPGSGAWQGLETSDGSRVVDHVADFVEAASRRHAHGEPFGPVGAVVGATHPEEAAELRRRMPHVLFLVPGMGAQGGTTEDIRACVLTDGESLGTGAIITASRSVIYAPPEAGETWSAAVARAARTLRDQVAGAVTPSAS